jgi:SH3 domain-containing YSC84-like protein 1
MTKTLRFVSAALLVLAPLQAKDAGDRLKKAGEVFREIMATSDKSIPQDLLAEAKCVVIVPGLKKGAFIVGAKFGRGYMSCRKQGNVGWSAPGAVKVEGGSLGFQIGGSETDVIMVVLNEKGMEKLLESKFTVGGNASVAAGPVGRTASAETDAKLRAEILTYSRSRGVFAGVALNGATLRPDLEANQEIYGKELDNKAIVMSDMKVPAVGEELIALLNKYSSRK